MIEFLFLLGVVVLVAANGFFVAAEFGLVRARHSRLEQMRAEGVRGTALAMKQVDEIDQYLSACQLGITMASLGIGFLGEPAIASLLEPAFGGAVSHGLAVAISLAIAYLITTSLHITFGEQVPKIYSIVNAEATVRRTARPLELFKRALSPLIWSLNSASNAILRVIGVDPARRVRRGEQLGGPQAADRAERARRQDRPGRGQDALGRLPPPRAAGAPGDDADPGGGHRRRLRERGDGASAHGGLRPHQAGRDRGGQHRPDPRHRARELARRGS